MHAYENFEKTGVYNSSVPALTTLNSNNEHEVSEFYIENGSYIKLKSLTLGYTLPKAVLDKMKMRHARIYFQAQNLFTITGYTGADLKVWVILIRCPVRSLWDYHLVSKL